MTELFEKVAIVTGAAMGYKAGGPSIGGAISIRLASDGFRVVVVDIGDMGKRTVDIVRENGGEAIFIQADITITDEVRKVVQTTKEKFGGLHNLVNCVARYSDGMAKNIAEISEEEWNETLGVNLNGYFKMIKYSVKEKRMKKSQFTPEQITFALRQAESGTPVPEVCRKMGISEQTFYRWKKKYLGMGIAELRRLRVLEEENKKLKQLVADLSLDKQMLQDVLRKKA